MVWFESESIRSLDLFVCFLQVGGAGGETYLCSFLQIVRCEGGGGGGGGGGDDGGLNRAHQGHGVGKD